MGAAEEAATTEGEPTGRMGAAAEEAAGTREWPAVAGVVAGVVAGGAGEEAGAGVVADVGAGAVANDPFIYDAAGNGPVGAVWCCCSASISLDSARDCRERN